MKEDLHELIDGTLPDEQAAELLHLLSVDPEKRSLFRQQIVLQRDLCRNERHAPMTALEETEMLGRISRSIGLGVATQPPGLLRRGVAMLAVGFIVGSSVGYFGHGLVGKDSMTDSAARDTVELIRMLPAPPGPVLDRDSLVAAVRDSLAAEAKPSARTSGVTRRSVRSGRLNDPTGAPEARELARRKRSR